MVVNVVFKAWMPEADLSLNLYALLSTVETPAVMVLSVLISTGCCGEARGFMPRYGRNVDSDPKMMTKS